jgi:peptide/nickel transport system permease protein
VRRLPALILVLLFAFALLADWVAPYSFEAQFREAPDAPPNGTHLLGTDSLGRDRLSRLLHGARVSLLLAPAAALVSVSLAVLIALLAGSAGAWCERGFTAAADLVLSLPWIFLLIAARALLPLNTSPGAAALVTFGLLGALGWAGPSRVMLAAVKRGLASDFALLARASGCGRARLALVHVAPHLKSIAFAQLLVTTPAFLLAEASLGLLGLGIPEPLPSWGGLLRELESLPDVAAHPWTLAPALALILVVGCMHLAIPDDECHV